MKRMFFVVALFAILLFFICPMIFAAEIHVPADYSTIQAAINASSDGDTILVSPGNYMEAINFSGKAITVKSTDGPDVTTIDADDAGTVVTFNSGEGFNSVLDGFTIRDGWESGIRCIGASPSIANNKIFYNNAYAGGGIFIGGYSAPIIEKNTIAGNQAINSSGGGILISSDEVCQPIVRNNFIYYNFAVSGAGISITGSHIAAVFTNNIIYENTATGGRGGGVYFEDGLNSVLIMTNNTLFDNFEQSSPEGHGHAIYLNGLAETDIFIVNNIISNHYGDYEQIKLLGETTATIIYNDVKGGWPGEGNIDFDPLFVGWYNNDFHLQEDSLCINAGTNLAPMLPLIDYDAQPRIGNNVVDMGADEYYINSPPVASNLTISPSSPVNSDNLTGSYDYSDPNNFPESGSEIRWHKNDQLQETYNDQLNIPASETTKGQVWYFTVKPKNEYQFGDLATSPSVTIQNTLPTVSNLTLSPQRPRNSDNLIAAYTFHDDDADAENGTEIRWYKNGVVQTALNNLTLVPASATEASQDWYFTVRPKDGEGFGQIATSPTVRINTPPEITEAYVWRLPYYPADLRAVYSYSDADGDPQNGTRIYWYKNSVLQPQFNDLTYISGNETLPGQIWYFVVVPCDGLEYGQQRQSQSAIIVTPPVEENYCFLAGTPILMADGSTKAIEQVKVGDKIIAFDEKTGELKKDKVTEFFEHDAQEYLIVNGHLKVTANHLVYHNGKWVEIGKLKIGDSLLDSQGKPQQITDIKKMRASVKVYNLEVNPYHTYFAGGFLVHNKVRIRPR